MTWLLGVALALAAALLALPWWRPSFASRPLLRRRAANVRSYRTRLVELSTESEIGLLPADSAEALKQDAAASLLADVQPDAAATPVSGRRWAPVLAAAALLLAFGAAGYFMDDTWRTQRLIDLAASDPAAAQVASLDRMVEKLEKEVKKHPDDADHWQWLGRGYREQGKYEEAAMAFAHARSLRSQDDPDLLVDEGEALLYASKGSFAGAPAERINKALQIAPMHPRALWYSGLMMLHNGDEKGALKLWERIPLDGMSDDARETVTSSIAELRQRTGEKAPAAPAASAVAAGSVQLKLQVALAPALAASVQPGDALFVFAQSPEGGMPLAVRKLSADALPLEVTLDDSNSPMPARKLSSADAWKIVARVSHAGGVQAASGDLQGELQVNRAQAGRPIHLTIDRKIE